MHRPLLGLIATGFCVCALAACGGSSDDESASTTTAPTTSTTEPDTTTTEAAGAADLDLRVTGTYVLQIKGKYGKCTGTVGTFSFAMTGKDVDGIGDQFAVEHTTSGSLITWKIDSTNSYEGRSAGSSSSAGASVQLDEDLKRVGGPSDAPPRPVHVAGTITCP
jgi:hypothetical protein